MCTNVATSGDFFVAEVEDSYQGARLEGDTITLEFVKKMMDDFKNQRSVHRRCVSFIHLSNSLQL